MACTAKVANVVPGFIRESFRFCLPLGGVDLKPTLAVRMGEGFRGWGGWVGDDVVRCLNLSAFDNLSKKWMGPDRGLGSDVRSVRVA